MATLPRVIITSGEPAGIGPDLCLALATRPLAARLLCAADPGLLRERSRRLGLDVELAVVDGEDPPPHRPGRLAVLPIPLNAPVVPGHPDPANAHYVLEMLRHAADGCLRGRWHAMVTAPVQKSVINDAGVVFSGHTEYLAERCGVRRPVMLLVADRLRVALATTHLPLRAVPDTITQELLLEVLDALHGDLQRRFGLEVPRITVCGLNPHAGEGGHLGNEEQTVLAPAIEQARARGMQLTGPLAGDTAFTPPRRAVTDAYLAMYHDQGLAPLKALGFGHSVNVTLGLPIIRTSVDHGTALDLAGRGGADSGSLQAALALACELAGRT